MDPYSSPYMAHCGSFYFLFHSFIPSKPKERQGNSVACSPGFRHSLGVGQVRKSDLDSAPCAETVRDRANVLGAT